MELSSNLTGIFLALIAAATWGGGDFSGGLASRRSNLFQVLVITSVTGIVLLMGCALLSGEALPASNDVLWALAAGLSGAIGIAALYQALALGNAASVAPTSAVLCALLPVVFTMLTSGLPGTTQLIGFLLALPGIWLVAQSGNEINEATRRKSILLAWLAGTTFGGFFILIAQVQQGAVFFPLVISRFVTLGVALLLLFLNHSKLPSFRRNPIALLGGLLDTSGNIFYLLAHQFIRLDVVAVISSFYPATTVLLSRLVLKESTTRRQWVGVVLCLGAIVLITL